MTPGDVAAPAAVVAVLLDRVFVMDAGDEPVANSMKIVGSRLRYETAKPSLAAAAFNPVS